MVRIFSAGADAGIPSERAPIDPESRDEVRGSGVGGASRGERLGRLVPRHHHADIGAIAHPLEMDMPDVVVGVAAGLGEGIAEPDERLVALYTFIGQLDPLNRALILLYLEDRSYIEMAEILGISETNVATKISRIKQKLRGQMTTAETTGA